MAVTGRVETSLQANVSRTNALSSPSDVINLNVRKAFTDGDAADKVSKEWHDQRTLTQNTAEDLDLSGSLENALGDACVFTKVRAIFIRNNSAASTLKVGGDANSLPLFGAAADYLIIKPGGSLLLECISLAAGYAVGAGATDILQIQHGGENAADLTYDIGILGS